MSAEPTTFGSYRLLEPLGEGAMGTVWRAMDLRLERLVALKLLRDADEARHRALLAEAKLACQLNHPNIAHIYDAGEVEGVPYIAMELVEGQTLRRLTRKGRLDEAALRSILKQAAGALHHAHQKGIVHRDIKPENLVLTEEGTLKILDFGIARRGGNASVNQTAHHMTLIERTAPGYSQGTPAYMSPEQANGQPLTGRSDQFSLGVVLYELASGTHPFLRENLVETLFAVVKAEPESLAQQRRDLSPAFCGAVHRMLAKEESDRYPDLAMLAQSLEPDFETARVPLVPKRPLRNRRPWILGAVALALLAVGGGAGLWLARRGPGEGPEGGLAAARRASTSDFARGRRVVAILPLEQTRPDADHAWLGTGFADAMAFGLVQREDLLVLDRLRVTEAMHHLGQPQGGLGELGRALRADWLVLGTYQVLGDRLRLGVRVVEAATGATLHQFQVDRPASEVLAVEDELQQRLPKELGLGSEAALVRFRAKDPRTRELYTKGNQVLTEGNQDSLRLAQQFFRAALDREPEYAPAHAGLAWTLEELAATTAITSGRFGDAQKLLTESKAEAERAIQLEPGVGQAYRALSAALLRLGDLDGASRAALQAVRLDPSDYKAYDVLADVFAGLEGTDNHEVARRYFEKSLGLFPENWHSHHRLGVLLQNDGDLAGALEHADRAIALRAGAEFAYVTAADALYWMGRPAEAEARLQAGLREVPGSNLLRTLLAYGAFERGDKAATLRMVQELQGAWPPDHSNAVLLDGLKEASEGRHEEAERRFLGLADRLRAEAWDQKKHNERRVLSVNLYFMARTLSQLGRREGAERILDLADRFHPGKRAVAKRDPAFR